MELIVNESFPDTLSIVDSGIQFNAPLYQSDAVAVAGIEGLHDRCPFAHSEENCQHHADVFHQIALGPFLLYGSYVSATPAELRDQSPKTMLLDPKRAVSPFAK
jgi:hypothetical protein